MTNSSRISIIVPCRNEAEHIGACIESLYKQKLDNGELEVLIVDGMSDDSSRWIVEQWQARWPAIRLIENQKKLTPYAFNLGIKQSTGDIVCIVGARNVLSPNYVSDGIKALLSNEEVACVGGQFLNKGESPLSNAIAKAMSSPFGVGAGNFRALKKDQFVDTAGVPIYRKTSLEKVGLFDESLHRNQDDDLNFRLRQSGGKILFCGSISTEYIVRSSLKRLFSQYQQYGYWKVFVNRKHKTATNLRQLVPPLALILGFLLVCASAFSPSAAITLLSLCSLYTLLALGSSIKSSSGLGELMMMPVAIATLHLGYGLGYLRGIWDFLILRRSAPDNYFANLTR
jgi:glycosyltransferase involved in cell wall biosynthesis